MSQEEIFIISGARSPIGRFMGTLSNVPTIDLGAHVAREAIKRSGAAAEAFDASVFANVVTTKPRDLYTSRAAGLEAGLPESSTAVGVNRLCGSGAQAIVTAAQHMASGDSELAIAGGVEIMSRAPYTVAGMREGQRMGEGRLYDWLTGALTCPMGNGGMGITAENVAAKYGISRERQDEFALLSQERALAAIEAGRFTEQIVPVPVKIKRKDALFETDEHPRATTLETLAGLRPTFQKDGTVTAGNSSGINDAAAVVTVGTASAVKKHGLEPQARVVSWSVAGVDPAHMGIGPVVAVPKALKKAGLTLDDMDFIESNEAFAAQAVAVSDALHFDPEKTNVDGGAIALGHPIGATGVILTIKVIDQLRSRGGRYGLVTMCIGGGQGIALIVEVNN